jgi:hypothetical protein
VPVTFTVLVVLADRPRPVGKAVNDQVYGATPPVIATGDVYAPFTFPAAIVVVVTEGGGTRLMVNVADLFGSVIEVAFTVAVLADAMLPGALYVTVLVVDPVNDPRPLVIDQFTPALPGSLVTVAVINCVLPWSRVTGVAGASPTVIAALIVTLRPLAVAVKPNESVTFTLNCKVVAVVGVPLITPVFTLMTKGAIEPLEIAYV